MFAKELQEKYPFLTEYFEAGIQGKNIPQSILFYGQDIFAQYSLATEIARILNCKENKEEECNCINCNWINEKQHPAVITISKIDSKPSDDDSKTVISIAQARMIKSSLLNTSDYHRVFIFCDAKMEGENWIPLGLNKTNFQEEIANSLLKTIEEPPENTTFFFLTRDKNDLIETIISRSQSFFVPSYKIENRAYSIIEDYFTNYPNIQKREFLDLAQDLFLLSKEHGNEKILEEIQNYMLEVLKNNLENPTIKSKILSDIKTVKLAQQVIDSRVNSQLAFENMCLDIGV